MRRLILNYWNNTIIGYYPVVSHASHRMEVYADSIQVAVEYLREGQGSLQ